MVTWSDFNEVAPGLFVGSKPPPGRPAGADVLVLAASEHQPPSAWFPEMLVVRAPLEDTPTRVMREEEIRTALRTASLVVERLRAGCKVLVTCAMGWNRSALIAALALQKLQDLSVDEIITRMRQARGIFSLSNPNFEKLLRLTEEMHQTARVKSQSDDR